MYLTASNLAHYLLSRGRIGADSVVSGDFRVVEAGRRNRNFKVIRRRSPGLFVKQVMNDDPLNVATLQREAACYQGVLADQAFSLLAEVMPRLVDYDFSRRILILELLPNAQNLNEYHTDRDDFPLPVAGLLAQALATLHSETGRVFAQRMPPALFPRRRPWVLNIHRSEPGQLPPMSRGNWELLAVLKRFPELLSGLDRLRHEWRRDGLIHGDVKWDNFLVFPESGGLLQGRMVDWELADLGDFAWDVGAVIQAYLAWPWLRPSTAVRGETEGGREQTRRALRCFWEEYAAQHQSTRAPRPARRPRSRPASAAPAIPSDGDLLDRSMSCAAARMVQTAYEHAYYAQQLPENLRALVRLGADIILDPAAATQRFLGL